MVCTFKKHCEDNNTENIVCYMYSLTSVILIRTCIINTSLFFHFDILKYYWGPVHKHYASENVVANTA